MATDTEPAVDETATAPAPGPSPDAQRLAEVVARNREVLRLTVEHAEQANRAKAARKRLEAAQEGLSQLIAGMDEEYPLFDRPNADVPVAPVDAWRSVPVGSLAAELGLPRKLVAALAEAGLDTLGKLADWTSEGHALTEIKGVGDQGAERIADALAAYWGGHEAPGGEDPGPTNGEADRVISDWLEGAEAEARDAAGRAATRTGGEGG